MRVERKKLSVRVTHDAEFPTAPTAVAIQDANLRFVFSLFLSLSLDLCVSITLNPQQNFHHRN